MSKLYVRFAVLTGFSLLPYWAFSQNIAINTTGTAAGATHMLEVTQSSSAANMVALYAIHSAATAAGVDGYALQAIKTGATGNNIAGYFSASGGGNNYGIIVPSGGGKVGIGTSAPGYLLETAGDIYANGGWLRVSGNAGLYFESWGGGWYMADATWIRSYNSKNVYINSFLRADGGIASGGLATPGAGAVTASDFINSNVGFRVNSAAASGSFLRGNGTNYVSSSILAADIPAGSGNYIQNQYAAAQATANYWISGEGRVGSWFRNSAANTGLYNEATTAGIYSPSANLMSTYNSSSFQIEGASTAAGNLRFSAANPYITASSYFICPGGAYFNSGTVYTEAQYQCRGGIHNDAGSYLTVAGGTAANNPTYFSGYVGVGVTAPNEQVEISKNFRFPATSGSTVGVIMQGANRLLHTYGTSNLFLGYLAGNFTTSGTGQNTGVGYQALTAVTTGYYNTALGYRSLASSNGTAARGNTALGAYAMEMHTGNSSRWNTAIGYGALAGAAASVDAQNNTAVGGVALSSSTTGSWNTAVGTNAAASNTTGTRNTAIGNSALIGYQTGNNNTAIGAYAIYNSLSETGAGAPILGGSDNTAVGQSAMLSVTSGSKNTSIGSLSMPTLSTGSNNTAVGYQAGWGAAAAANSTCIGYQSGGMWTASANCIEIGNSSNSTIGGQVAWSTLSDARIKDNVKENVPGLAFINKLRPVTYNLNIHRENEMAFRNNGKVDTVDWEGKYDIEKIRMTGFIAQEVEKAAKEAGYDFSGVGVPANPNLLYSLRYSDFVMPLVKSVQELSAKNEELQKTVDLLLRRIEVLEKK